MYGIRVVCIRLVEKKLWLVNTVVENLREKLNSLRQKGTWVLSKEAQVGSKICAECEFGVCQILLDSCGCQCASWKREITLLCL